MSAETKTVEIIVKGQQANASLREIQSASRVLNAELKKLPVNSQEFIDKTKELQEVNKRLKSINDDVKGVGGVFGQISKEVKAFGLVAMGTLGFEFITGKIKDLIGQNAKLSDSFAEIQRTTGMTEAEVRKLNKAFSQLDTRTSTADLREIAAAAGQLGISKKDILSFTAATDKLVVALGTEFSGGAEEVTKTMGTLRTVFSDIKSDNVSDDMLHIGNAINQLASAGLATGPVVADFANRIGGVGINLGLTSGQVLGLSATLQELNVSTERGGTAISKILLKMTQHADTFAKVAGVGTKEFGDLLNKDLYSAFMKVVEGSKKSGASATEFSAILDSLGVDGAGASEVFSKLGTNTKLLQEKVDLANDSLKGTDSIMNAFNLKNETFGSKIDKIGKAIAGAFTNSAVMDGMNKIADGLVNMLVHTDKVSSSMAEEQTRVNALMIEIKSANTTNEQRKKIYEELKAINPDIVKGIDAENISITTLTGNVKKYNTEQVNRIVIQKMQEKIDDANKDAADKRIEMANQQTLAYEKLTGVEKLRGYVGIRAREITNNEKLGISEKVEALRKLGQQEEWTYKNGNYYRNSEAQKLNDIVGFLGRVEGSEKQYNKSLDVSNQLLEEKNKMMKQLGITADEVKKKEEAPKASGMKKLIEPDADAMQKAKDARKKLLEDIDKIEEEYFIRFMDKNDKELAAIELKYARLRVAAQGNKTDLKRIDELFNKEFNEALKKQDEAEIEENKKKQEKIEEDMVKHRQAIYDAEDEAYLNSLTGMDKEIVATMQKYEKLELAAGDDARAVEAIKEEERIAINNIVQKGLDDEAKMREKHQREMGKIASRAALQIGSSTMELLKQYDESQKIAEDAAMQRTDDNYNRELRRYKGLLDAKKISEKDYNAKVDALNRERDNKQKKIQHDQFERERDMKVANALLAGAEGSAQIWGQWAAYPIVAAALEVIKDAAMLLSISNIESTPNPYAKGGYNRTSDDPQGYTTGATLYTRSASGKAFIAGEAGMEWISPSWMLSDPETAPMIQTLEMIRQAKTYATGGGNGSGMATTAPTYKSTVTVNMDKVEAVLDRLVMVLDGGIGVNYDIFERSMQKISNSKNAAKVV